MCGILLAIARPTGACFLHLSRWDIAIPAMLTGSGLIQGTDGPGVIAGSNEADEIYGNGDNGLICGRGSAEIIHR